jgi:acetyl-CoA carboxylase biotin carboxyl carrier protein
MGMINEQTLKRLISLVEESEIDELEISRWGTRVKITRRRARESSNGAADAAPALAEESSRPVAARPVAEPVVAPPAPANEAPAEGVVEIKSPMVGTFYAAPSPAEPPFVNVNDHVAPGKVVCIIEAMKLMNEIHAEVSGRVAKVLVTNGQPVEYNQPLFLIDTRG